MYLVPRNPTWISSTLVAYATSHLTVGTEPIEASSCWISGSVKNAGLPFQVSTYVCDYLVVEHRRP